MIESDDYQVLDCFCMVMRFFTKLREIKIEVIEVLLVHLLCFEIIVEIFRENLT